MMPRPMKPAPIWKTKSPNSGVVVRAMDMQLMSGSPSAYSKGTPSGIFSMMMPCAAVGGELVGSTATYSQ